MLRTAAWLIPGFPAQLSAWRCNFPDNRFGDDIFLADPHHLLVPSHMGAKPINGMHGFSPEHEDSDATYLTNDPTRFADTQSIVDCYHLMKAALIQRAPERQQHDHYPCPPPLYPPGLGRYRASAVQHPAASLSHLGHASRIVTTTALDNRQHSVDAGIPVERHGYSYGEWPLSAKRKQRFDYKGGNCLSLGLSQAIRHSNDVHVVHCHTGNRLGASALAAARQRHIPCVLTLHGGHFAIPDEERADLAAANPPRHGASLGQGLFLVVGQPASFGKGRCTDLRRHRRIRSCAQSTAPATGVFCPRRR